MATNLLDTDSEDELPAAWEERVTNDGKVYYANHSASSTQWEHPSSGKRRKVAGELPYGWEKLTSDSGHLYYVDHINNKTTYTDPRLAFAVEDRGDDRTQVKQRFDGSSKAEQILLGRDLTGQYAIVTGANTGIGYETARSLARHGAHVVLACRDVQAGEKAAQMILAERVKANVVVMHCDLASLKSVKLFVEDYISKKWPLQMLILNAGIFGMPYSQTEDGIEKIFQVNYLGHFYLCQLLLDTLVASKPARVVCVTAESHRFTDLSSKTITQSKLSPRCSGEYRPILAYNQSKLCILLLAMELNKRFSIHGVCAHSVHPGNMMSTGLSRHWFFYRLLFTLVRPWTKSKEQGASTTVYAATARELEGIGGWYFVNCFRIAPSDEAFCSETANKLWKLSESMLQKAGSKHEDMMPLRAGAVHVL